MQVQDTPVAPTAPTIPGDWPALTRSWRRTLIAANRADNTVRAYTFLLGQCGQYLADKGMPTNVASITREHLQEYLTHQLAMGKKPATVRLTTLVLKLFFGWLVEEGELTSSPAQRLKAPSVPEPVTCDARPE
jgi:site-specific recombinase XerD